MGSVRALRRSVTLRALFAVWFVGIALLSMAPVFLGPALTPIVAAVDAAHHLCACGMKPGTCGCPACERKEHELLSEKDPLPLCPVLKSGCDDGPVALSTMAIRPSILPASGDIVRATESLALPAPIFRSLASLEAAAPPTPPPRA